MATQTLDIDSSINQWGNGLALRLNKAVAKTAGVSDGTPVHIHAELGRIVIETVERRPTLDDMLAAFDQAKHTGEAMAFKPMGAEVIG